MEIVRCKRCNRVLTNENSIKVGYGKKCYRIISLQEKNKITPGLENILDRIRKLELDNNFMKHQLKHKTIVSNSKDSMLDWDLKPEIKEVKNEYKIVFNVIVKELKVIFKVDKFDYHNVLKPINVRETPEEPPLTENSKIIIENLELIH